MNCEQIAALLDRHGSTSLPPDARERATEHIYHCESCSNAWRSIQMLHFLRDQPTPAPRPELFEKAMQLAASANSTEHVPEQSQPWLRGIGLALAASLVLVATLTLMPSPDRADTYPANELTIALNETRDISVAIDSEEAMSGVDIRVLLSGGIELEGFRGRSAISWTTDLNAGVNKLTLPVSAISDERGELLVELEHHGKRREFLVRFNATGIDRGAGEIIGRIPSSTRNAVSRTDV